MSATTYEIEYYSEQVQAEIRAMSAAIRARYATLVDWPPHRAAARVYQEIRQDAVAGQANCGATIEGD
jgi:hypothetical protein